MSGPQTQTPTLAGAGVLGNQAALDSNLSRNSIAQGAISQETARAYVKALDPIFSRVRRDISAVKLSDGSRWTTEPLNVANLAAHVSGGLARGACPIKEGESTTRLALLDLDSHKGETSWPQMVEHAVALRDHLDLLYSLRVIPWRSSGGRGMHLYMLWDEPQDAYSVRQVLIDAIEALGYQNRAGKGGVAQGFIEVFPRQDAVGEGEKGNQFILPLAGASVPLDNDMQPMVPEMVEWVDWKISEPVLHREAPPRATASHSEGLEPIEKVRAALMSIPNDGGKDSPDYDEWFGLVCAAHEATGGSDEGQEVVVVWSEQNPVFEPAFFNDRVWPYIKSAEARRSGGITRGTLFGKARAAGWSPGAAATPDGFEDVVGAAAVIADAPACLVDDLGLPIDVAPTVVNLDPYGLAGSSPPFARKKDGSPLATIGNLLMAARRSDYCGYHVGQDRFSDETMLAPHGTEEWRNFTDADYTRLREYLEKIGFEPIGKENMRDAVHLVASEQAFDSAQLWLSKHRWDGVPRVEQFLTKYAGAKDGPYTRAVSRYMWSALAGRVLAPGCKADMAPVLVGAQGVGKSSLVAAMAPSESHYAEVDLRDRDDDLSRMMRGRLVAELGELQGMGSREIESVKAFITRTHENWVPKFKEFATLFPRRLLFIGTTNKEQFLADETGNRRWLPVAVEGTCDAASVAADRDQLWAEGADLHRENGVMWREAERLARDVHKEFVEVDPWTPRIVEWIRTERSRAEVESGLAVADVARYALGLAGKEVNRQHEMRIGKALLGLGLRRQRVTADGVRTYKYFGDSASPYPGKTSDEVGEEPCPI